MSMQETSPTSLRKLLVRLPVISQFSLLKQFMLLSGAILLIGAAAIGWWIDHQIVQEVTNASIKVAAVFVDSTIAPHIWELAEVDEISDIQRAHLNQLLQNNIRSQEFAAFNIWRPDGALIYSSLGEATVMNESIPGVAIAGRGQIHTSETQGIYGLVGSSGKEKMLETYFPVRAPEGDEVIAIVAFYQRLQGLQESIADARLRSWLVVGTATLLMYVILYSIVRRGSDTILSQQEDLRQSRRQIQQAAVRAADLNEASMRRLGSDLHDGPAQDLGIALMRMEPLRQALESHANAGGQQPLDLEQVAFDLDLIQTALQSSLQEVRYVAGGLRLPELSDLDVAGVIHKAVTDYMRKTGRKVKVTGPDRVRGSDALKSAMYRIVQETLNNGHLHGEPAHQWIDYRINNHVLTLEARDDGKGFDLKRLEEQGGRRQLGLAGLQERAEILGGHVYVQSGRGEGTIVRAVLPLNNNQQEEAG